jgi:hypothetical protein
MTPQQEGGEKDGIRILDIEFVSECGHSAAFGLQSALVLVESKLRDVLAAAPYAKTEIRITLRFGK